MDGDGDVMNVHVTVLKTGKLKAGAAAIAAVGVLLAGGCSSSQKPAALGAASGGAAASGGTGTAGAASGTPTSGASGASGTPSAPAGVNGGSSSSAASGASGPAPGTVVTSPLPNGTGTFVATVPGDPNGVAALAVYQQFVAMTSRMSQTATYDKDFANLADLGALSTSETGVTQMRDQNIHVQGTMSAKATVTNVNMGAQPLPMVSITSCVDQSKWAFYYTSGAKKGQKAPYGVIAPYVVFAKVHKTADGKWRVTDVTSKEQKCS